MDLAALGLPMEQVRNVWLVAFFIYLACCLLVEVAYPTLINAERARNVYISVKGSPVEAVKKKIEKLAEDGPPLTDYEEEKALRKAETQLENIKGSSITMDFGHGLLYVGACFVTYATFALYWFIVDEGSLINALALPFLMVYLGARWGRRGWRDARGFSPDERALGMPDIYVRTLGRLSAPFRRKLEDPRCQPCLVEGRGEYVMIVLFLQGGVFILFMYMNSLLNVNRDRYSSSDIGVPSILLSIPYILSALMLLFGKRTYYRFTPTAIKRGRVFQPAKEYKYSDIEQFKIYPVYAEGTRPNEDMPSGWRLAITLVDGRYESFGFGEDFTDYLVAHIAFNIEQGRWADVDSPEDRELLEKYLVEGRPTCFRLGYKPTNELTEKAARIASFRTVN